MKKYMISYLKNKENLMLLCIYKSINYKGVTSWYCFINK